MEEIGGWGEVEEIRGRQGHRLREISHTHTHADTHTHTHIHTHTEPTQGILLGSVLRMETMNVTTVINENRCWWLLLSVCFCRQLSDSRETRSGSHCHSLLIKPIQLPRWAISCLFSMWDSVDVFFSWLQTPVTDSNAESPRLKDSCVKFEEGYKHRRNR